MWNRCAVFSLAVFLSVFIVPAITFAAAAEQQIALPKAKTSGGISVEQALNARRSHRRYADTPLTLKQVGQLMWAAQGINDPRGLRTAPSAGGTYPLTLYLVAGNVEGLEPAVYMYHPQSHRLIRTADRDRRAMLAGACMSQPWVKAAPASIVFVAERENTSAVYGRRGIRYVDMEVGHAAQNIYLQTVPLGLGTVAVGACDDAHVARVLNLEAGLTPLYVMPIGKVAKGG